MASSSAGDPLVHVAFNSKATHFVAATASGIRVFSCSPFKHVFSKDFPSPDGSGSAREVVSADAVHSGLLVAVVFRESSAGAAAALDGDDGMAIRYWSELHGKTMPEAMNPTCGRAVRAVRHVGCHVLVAGEDRVALHKTSRSGVTRRMEVDTGPNPLGVCALAEAQARTHGRKEFVLACRRPAKGEVRVHRGGAGRVDVAAHSSSVVCVALSRDGRLLATAGSKGTVLRIFTTTDGKMVQQLRRGADRADIYSMVFSPDSKWLAVSSDKGTIHVFSVNVDLSSLVSKDSHDPNNLQEGLAPNANQGSYWSLLSGFVPQYFKQDGSLAKFRLREGEKYLVAFSHEPNIVLIIGMDGSFYRCKFDPVNAGEMKQMEYINFMKIKWEC